MQTSGQNMGTGFPGDFFLRFPGDFFQAPCSIANGQATNDQLAESLLVACWLARSLDGVLAGSLAGLLACLLPRLPAFLLAARMADLLACFLVVTLAGSLAAWRTCLLARWMAFLLACFHPYFHPCSSGCPCFPCFPWGDVFLRICFFSVWGTFPCYLLHFGAKTSTLLNFAAKICHLHCSPIFPWFLSVFPWCSLIYPKFSSFH